MMSFFIGLLTVVLVLDCLLLILLVLIQLPKKEAGAGIAFGGGATDALFGAGSGNALTKITKYAAGAFLGLSLVLSVMRANHSQEGSRTREAEGAPSDPRALSLVPSSASRDPGGPHLSILAAVVLLAGCGPSEPPADLIIINGAEPESLDPGILTGQADGRVALELFEGLTRYDPRTAAPIPGLAERWDLSPDGTVYTFHLRTNAVWSTGGPITAGDFEYSWLRVLNPETASEYAGQLFYLKNGEEYCTGKLRDAAQVGVKATGDRTLRVELKNPTPFFLDLCALQTLRVVPRQAIEKYGDRRLMMRPVPSSGAD